MISGCSGGGKSTLLAELAGRGYAVVEEPGRRIVQEELAGSGAALPWVDAAAFARRAITVALADRMAARRLNGWVFFDRGLIDAAAALQPVGVSRPWIASANCIAITGACSSRHRGRRSTPLTWSAVMTCKPESSNTIGF